MHPKTKPGLARSRVYETLRNRILSGELKPGTPLVLTTLAESLGASRTPVREALVRLLNSGLVTETVLGLSVKRLTEDEILEVYELRVPLEALAARLAAANRTPSQLTRMQVIHERFLSAASDPTTDPAALASMNILLHREICEAARNPLLTEFLGRIYDIVGGFGNTTYSRPGRAGEAAGEHEALVAAIGARNQEAAEEIARRHMTQAFGVRLAMYRDAQMAVLTEQPE
jgi:DNA-binding GntR family transcriptional regulator